MHELRRVYRRLPGGGVLQLRSSSDRQYRADAATTMRSRSCMTQRRDLVLRRVYVVPARAVRAAILPLMSSRRCGRSPRSWVSSSRARRGGSNWPSSAPSGRISSVRVTVCTAETGEARAASRAGYGLGVDLRERQGGLRTVFTPAYNRPRSRGAAQAGRPVAWRSSTGYSTSRGGKEFFDTIERHSDRKAREMGYDGADDEYMMDTYTKNSNEHY